MEVSESRGTLIQHSANSRILIIRTPKYGTPFFLNLPFRCRAQGSGFKPWAAVLQPLRAPKGVPFWDPLKGFLYGCHGPHRAPRTERLGFWVLGIKVLGFRVLAFRVLGLRALGLRV